MEAYRLFDIDIDVVHAHDHELGTKAMIYNETLAKVLPHPTGVYLEKVPTDALTGLCTFDYEYGNTVGFAKLDILSNSAYEIFKNKEDLITHVDMEPEWEKFTDPEFYSRLPHVANYGEMISLIAPKSVEEVADLIAMIRPSKQKLLDDYIKSKKKARRNLYRRPAEGGMYFKRAHAISYAVMIVAVFNKLVSKSKPLSFFG